MPANEIPYGANSRAGHYINAGDAKIYYEVYGKGKPVVVLHSGIVGSSYEMHAFIDSLSKHYQVIAVSTWGHGKSEMGAGMPTYERKTEDVNAIINGVTKDSVTVLGFSDGAYTGYFLAAAHPDKVKKLIAIGAGNLACHKVPCPGHGWRTGSERSPKDGHRSVRNDPSCTTEHYPGCAASCLPGKLPGGVGKHPTFSKTMIKLSKFERQK